MLSLLLNLLLFVAGFAEALFEYHDEPTYLFLQGTISHRHLNQFLGISLTELLTDKHTMAA